MRASIVVPLFAVVLFTTGCSTPHTDSSAMTDRSEAVALNEALQQRSELALAFARRSESTPHPADPAHCAAVRNMAIAFAEGLSPSTPVQAAEAIEVQSATAGEAETLFVRRTVNAQRAVLRELRRNGKPYDDEQAALAAIVCLSPQIPVPKNARGGSGKRTAPIAQTAAGGDEPYKAYEDYMKKRGFKSHPSYAPAR